MTKDDLAEVKKTLFNTLLRVDDVFVLIPHQHTELVLPKGLTYPLNLEYGLFLLNPIKDLQVSSRGISAVLSFQQTPTETFVPWEAVGAIKARSGCCQSEFAQALFPWLFGEFPDTPCVCGHPFHKHDRALDWSCSDGACKGFTPKCTCGLEEHHSLLCVVAGWEQFSHHSVPATPASPRPTLKLVP